MSPSALFVTTVPITLEAFLLPFADHFRTAGWRVDALATAATENPHVAGHFDEVFDATWRRNPLAPGNFLGAGPLVRRIVRDGQYDIVHVHTPVAAFVTRRALRSLRRERSASDRPAIIYTAHGFHFYEGQSAAPHALYRTMERTAARWTDFLVTINAEDYAAARAFGTIDPARVRLIPGIGVDPDVYHPVPRESTESERIRRELGLAPEAFMLTMVAEMAPVKRHAHLFRAIAQVRDPGVTLVLVGEGPLEVELKSLAESLGIAPKLRWAGYRRDVPLVLGASDAAVLVSEREGLPRFVLEAMSCARPVIGTDTRGIRDAIGSDAGWVVPKHDVLALARAIDEAAGAREARRRRGGLARERVLAEFSLGRVIGDYEELYDEALASRI